MMNKLVDFIKGSDVGKFFIVGLVLAIAQLTMAPFSIFPWLAVFISLVPVLTNLRPFKNKLSYGQKQHVKQASLMLSSLVWSIYMFYALAEYPSVYSLIFVVLSLASLAVFKKTKTILLITIPALVSFLILLVFVQVPEKNVFAFYSLFFSLFIISAHYFQSSIKKTSTTQDSKLETPEKLAFISELDSFNSENKNLKAQIKNLELDLSSAEMAKMDFLATMSHEIRTPLNGIIPLLDILLDSELSDFQRDYLNTAHLSAIQMQKLIDDLLDYSKVEAGKLTVETGGVKISPLLSSVNSSYQTAAQKKNLEIKIDIHHNVSPLLRGDPTRIRQVLSNLLSNAIKFSSRGTITLAAKKIEDYPQKELIRFEVIDQGIGLDKSTCENIFLPFTQEDASSTRKFGGVGLGLAISKKIVELMNGKLSVESEKNKGSTFYFDLPLLKSMGQISTGLPEPVGYQAILINTNPLLFNKVSKMLKIEKISFQKALGLSQAMEIYRSIKNISKQAKNVLVFIDFETAGKQARSLCEDLARNDSTEDLFACLITDNNNLAGLPLLPNILFLKKDESIADFVTKLVNSNLFATLNKKGDDIEEEKPPEDIGHEKQASIKPVSPKQLDSIVPEILLVEDNEINLKVAEKLIQYIGYTFEIAMNGQEALEKVKLKRYRMVLMDCQMPVMDGYKCTAKIRDYEKAAGLNRTPIIAMTANAMMGDREKCIDAGMDDYMSKPLNRYVLEKNLKKWDPLSLPAQNPNYLSVSNPSYFQQSKNQSKAPVLKQTPSIIKPSVVINQKWLNTKTLEGIKEFMGDEVVQLLEMYQQETPNILKKMHLALKNNNIEEVEKMAHMLKSTSANIGANGLSFFSRKMEVASKNKKIYLLLENYSKIKKAYVLTRREIAKYVNSQ